MKKKPKPKPQTEKKKWFKKQNRQNFNWCEWAQNSNVQNTSAMNNKSRCLKAFKK